MDERTSSAARKLVAAVLSLMYVSTWSAMLIQSTAVPPTGSGPLEFSASHASTKGNLQLGLTGRRFTPLVKCVSLVAPPPAAGVYPVILPSRIGVGTTFAAHHPTALADGIHTGRAPPTC